jgi:cell division protease FtsH
MSLSKKMFSKRMKMIIKNATNFAWSMNKSVLDSESLLIAILDQPETCLKLAECLTNGSVEILKRNIIPINISGNAPDEITFSKNVENVIETAHKFSKTVGLESPKRPNEINIYHFVCAVANSKHICKLLGDIIPIMEDEAQNFIKNWYKQNRKTISLSELVDNLRGLRSRLLDKIFGQNQAVQDLIEGLYNSQVTGVADSKRTKPLAVFVFAGPPGVGKTYLANTTAEFLGYPFKRFDMTAYSDHQDHNQLIGLSKGYQGAFEGALTGFVRKNTNAFLLFDEIEKAHLNTIQLFYQVLDSGTLQDRFHEENISFRDTTIIFTTNAGKSLYDNPNKSGISSSNAEYHRRTILNALENEINPTTGKPVFPQAICSRMGQGYPLMFNSLGVNDLEKIIQNEMTNTAKLFEKQYYKKISYSPVIPLAILLREGARVDARQFKAEAEKFIKNEIFKFTSQYSKDQLDDILEIFSRIRFEIDGKALEKAKHVKSIFLPKKDPKVLLISTKYNSESISKKANTVDWMISNSVAETIETLLNYPVDFVLLDLCVKGEPIDFENTLTENHSINQDKQAGSIDKMAEGREILRQIHKKCPDTIVYLLAINTKENSDRQFGEEINRSIIDDELFLACVRSGGARGLINIYCEDDHLLNDDNKKSQFLEKIHSIQKKHHVEKKIYELSNSRKVLKFETYSKVRKNKLSIMLSDFSFGQSIDAEDAGELISDVEKPSTKFNDVFGAKAAKQELQFIVKWLKNPRYFAAMGIRAPKGILLAGPPGTGKTMLARALAGETDCAFIEKSATGFVTVWQGSGPQNIRDLFERAKRYAPTVVFIDEIDAIGLSRQGGRESKAEENTLNSLLTEMDGFTSKTNKPVIVLAATNLADRLDDALKRRFDRTIEVDKPDKEDRLKYLEKVLFSRKACKVDKETIDLISRQSAQMTIADLERVIHSAGVLAAQKETPITDEILKEAFEAARMGEAKHHSDIETLKRVARHEAGHSIIACHGGNIPVQVTIVGRRNAGGYMERERDENRLLYSKSEIEQIICENMGGRAAEIIYYGEKDGYSTSVGSDLPSASDLAVKMVVSYGMDNEFGQFAFDPSKYLESPVSDKIIQQAQKIVDHQLKKAIDILKTNKNKLDKLTEILIEKNRIDREDLKKLFHS